MFKIIGELINSTRKNIRTAVENRDADYIRGLAEKQIAAGAYWVDVNGGARSGHEEEDMSWLIDMVQEISGETPLSLDSSDPAVLRMAYDKARVKPLINSISLETKRWDGLASFLEGKDCDVLALCMDDTGLPKTVDEALIRAEKLVTGLDKIGFKTDSIYIDPLIQPISTDVTKGVMAMESVSRIMAAFPGVHTTCGASNISYGMPQRRVINRYFMAMLIANGLDCAITDPLDEKMIEAIVTAEMLVGHDRFCRSYITHARAGKINA